MDAWSIFWAIVLIVMLIVFTGVALFVGIGGFADMKSLFRDIEEQHDEVPPDDKEE